MKLTQEQIFEKYPEIFKEKDLPMTETCMCWGLETPDEWFPIIDQLCNAMQNHMWSNGHVPKGMQVVAEQVKEKWRQLRFYYRLEAEEENLTKEQIEMLDRRRQQIDGMILLAEAIVDNLDEFYEQLKSVMEPEQKEL